MNADWSKKQLIVIWTVICLFMIVAIALSGQR